MARENSFSDSDGRSLTPDLDEEIDSPVQASPPMLLPARTDPMPTYQVQRPTLEAIEDVISAPASIHEHMTQTRSLKSPIRASGEHHLRPQIAPIEKFRASVRKVIALRRGSSAMTRTRVGAEPGVDPRRASANLAYGHIREKCLIEVVDYSSVRSSFGRMTNQEFIRLISDSRAYHKESWVKVRWINVGGVSWDVISALAIKYGTFDYIYWQHISHMLYFLDIHPLALEDLLHFRKNARSKADYYPKHLFLRVLCHSLISDEEAISTSPESSFTHLPRSESPTPLDEDESEDSWEKGKDRGSAAYFDEVPLPSRFTSRTSTLRNTVRRRLSRDVEHAPVTSSPAPKVRTPSYFPELLT